jgi:hypothetical protein
MLPTQNSTELGETFDTLDVIRRSTNLISPAAKALKLFETRPRRFSNFISIGTAMDLRWLLTGRFKNVIAAMRVATGFETGL